MLSQFPTSIMTIALMFFLCDHGFAEERPEQLVRLIKDGLGQGITETAGFQIRWAGDDYVVIALDRNLDINRFEDIENEAETINGVSEKGSAVIGRITKQKLDQEKIEKIRSKNPKKVVSFTQDEKMYVISAGEDKDFVGAITRAMKEIR